jgi:hypothetical protein
MAHKLSNKGGNQGPTKNESSVKNIPGTAGCSPNMVAKFLAVLEAESTTPFHGRPSTFGAPTAPDT